MDAKYRGCACGNGRPVGAAGAGPYIPWASLVPHPNDMPQTDAIVVLTTVATADEAATLFARWWSDAWWRAGRCCQEPAPCTGGRGRWPMRPRFVVLLKTRAARLEALQVAFRELHPYKVPEMLAFAGQRRVGQVPGVDRQGNLSRARVTVSDSNPDGAGTADGTPTVEAVAPASVDPTTLAQQATEADAWAEQGVQLCRKARWKDAIEPLSRAIALNASASLGALLPGRSLQPHGPAPPRPRGLRIRDQGRSRELASLQRRRHRPRPQCVARRKARPPTNAPEKFNSAPTPRLLPDRPLPLRVQGAVGAGL